MSKEKETTYTVKLAEVPSITKEWSYYDAVWKYRIEFKNKESECISKKSAKRNAKHYGVKIEEVW